jgi:hypothetical protein
MLELSNSHYGAKDMNTKDDQDQHWTVMTGNHWDGDMVVLKW